MQMLNPWRLPLLFFISGVAVRFAVDKSTSVRQFAWRRTRLLLIPILFGIYVVVAPQAWLQLIESGEITQGFWQFYPVYVAGSMDRYSIEIPTWNHLWYVVYLMFYTLLLLPFARPLSRWMNSAGKFGGAAISNSLFANRFAILAVLLVPALPHLLIRFTLDPIFPTTHNLVWDWANHAHSTVFLLTGFLLAKDAAFWQAIKRALNCNAVLTVLLAITLGSAWNNWAVIEQSETALLTARIGRVAYIWMAIALMLGIAQKFLNRPSPALSYMTEAIFPWYILHQTLIVMAGYWLTRQGVATGVELAALTIATFGGCYLINEYAIRRFKYIRPLFGLKPVTQLKP